MNLRVKKIAWFISLIISLLIAFTRCEKTPPSPAVGDFSISGQVIRSGKGVAGVDVGLTGEDSAVVRTDSLGAYVFRNLAGGLYRVQPQKSGFTFNPGALNLELARQDLDGQNFLMTATGPRLVPLRSSLEFGQVFIGSNRILTLGIGNIGSVTLTIGAPTFSNAAFRSTVGSLSLPPDSLVFVPVEFVPTAAGQISAQLTLTSNDSTNPRVVIALSGTGSQRGQPRIEVQPTSLAFGPVRAGSSSTLKITVGNPGADTLKIQSITPSDTTFKPSAKSAVILAGASIELTVTFAPLDTLQRGANLAFASNAASQPSYSLPMTGRGFVTLPSGIRVEPAIMDFGRVYIDSVRTRQFTVSNVGRDTLVITAFQFSDNRFSAQFNGDLIPPGQSRTYQMTLRALSLGQVQALLTIINSDPLQTRFEVPLLANITTVPPMEMRIEPQSLSFGDVRRGQTALKWIYIVNPTRIPIIVRQISSSSDAFRPLRDSLFVAPLDSARLDVEFTPSALGAVSGQVQMLTNVLGRESVTVAVNGVGTSPPSPSMEIVPASIDFGSVIAGATAVAAVGITNKGPGELTVSSFETSSNAFQVQNLGVFLPAGASQNVQLTFRPLQAGLINGSLTIRSNDPARPVATVTLTGAGMDTTGNVALMNLSTRSLDLGQVLVNLSAGGSFNIGNLGRDTLRVGSINSTRPEFKVTPNQTTVPPGGSRSVTVTFSPLSTGDFSAAVILMSNDQFRPIDSLRVSGKGVGVDPDVITGQEVFIPGGVFDMGRPGEEEPVRRITVNSFYMDVYEVTNQEFKAFMDAGGYNRREFWTDEGWQWRQTSREFGFNPANPRPRYWGGGETPWESDPNSNLSSTPVVGVSWFEASAYARYRGKQLPTEAQWEYAARGQSGRIYPWGDQYNGMLANHGQSMSPYHDASDGFRETAPVGSFPGGATPEGVHDLAGNVMEWCRDWYGDYNPLDTFNPAGPSSGLERVIRGGSWRGSTLFIRGFHRNRSAPKIRYPDCGIRLVRAF